MIPFTHSSFSVGFINDAHNRDNLYTYVWSYLDIYRIAYIPLHIKLLNESKKFFWRTDSYSADKSTRLVHIFPGANEYLSSIVFMNNTCILLSQIHILVLNVGKYLFASFLFNSQVIFMDRSILDIRILLPHELPIFHIQWLTNNHCPDSDIWFLVLIAYFE